MQVLSHLISDARNTMPNLLMTYALYNIKTTRSNKLNNKILFTGKPEKSMWWILWKSPLWPGMKDNYMVEQYMINETEHQISNYFLPVFFPFLYDCWSVSIILQPSPFFPNLYLIFQFNIIKNGPNRKSVGKLVKFSKFSELNDCFNNF